MRTRTATLLWVCLVITPSRIQGQFESGNDNPSVTTNLGYTMSTPLDPTSPYANAGWGLSAGAGYNFDRRNAVIGEFMWNWLTATKGALQPVRTALQSPNISGYGDLYTLNADYRFELRGKRFGTYLIGGGGWYYRTTTLSQHVPTGTSITCEPAWLWWGYNCSSGTATTITTVARPGSNVFGVNGGIGFTIRVGDAPYRLYAESRYHYAPTKNIGTQLIAITVGIRY
jgi:hypothetical protein